MKAATCVGAEPLDRIRERVGVVPGDLLDVRDEPAERGGVRGNPAERRAVRVDAVVGEAARDDRLLLGAALDVPERARELAGRVDRVGPAAGREEHLRVVDRSECGDARGELLGPRVRERPERVVRRELAHLAGGRLRELGAAVSDVAEPERAGRVDVLAAGVVPDDGALAAHDRECVLADAGHVRERMPERGVHAPMLRPRGTMCAAPP